MVVPIISDGDVLGIIDVFSEKENFFTVDHLNLIETLAAIVGSKIMLLKAYDELKSQASDLQVINSQYKQSAFVISHDIKSPLANIQGLIEVYRLNSKSGKHDENDQVLTMIEEVVQKLEGKVDDLNQVIAARNEPVKTARVVNFANLLDNIKMGIAMQIKNSNAAIIEDFSEVKSIKYPRSYLESIMVNLITNAIKYRSHDRDPEVRIRTFRVADFTVLEVSDNGIGIDLKKHGKKLFQLFQRFHRYVDGKGLGLNIVKSQIESLGGKIEVESKVGVGTVFRAYLKDLK